MKLRSHGIYIPAEVAAARRHRRLATVRLYALGAVLLVALGAGGLLTESHFLQPGVNASVHMAQAESAYERGDLRTAVREMDAAVAATRSDYRATYDLGLLLLKSGRYAVAFAQLQHAATLDNTSDAHFFSAIASLALHRPAIARREAQRANAMQPNDYATMALLAMADKQLGRTAASARELAAASSLGYQGQTIRQLIDAVPLVMS